MLRVVERPRLIAYKHGGIVANNNSALSVSFVRLVRVLDLLEISENRFADNGRTTNDASLPYICGKQNILLTLC